MLKGLVNKLQVKYHSSPWLVGAVLLITMLVLIAATAFIAYNFYQTKKALNHEFQIEQTYGDVRHYMEVLDMSLQMAVVTKDKRWIDRYHQYLHRFQSTSKKLNATLEKYPYILDAIKTEGYACEKMMKSNERIISRLETNQDQQAKAILNSGHYADLKRRCNNWFGLVVARKPDYFRMLQLRGEILRYDEILTMSARLEAVTGEAKWERRYRHFEPLLDTAIKEVIAQSPDVAESDAARSTDAANVALVKMENTAFDWVKAGRQKDALALLFGRAYEQQKQIYNIGMQKFYEALKQQAKDTLSARQNTTLVVIVIVVITLFMLAAVWLLLLAALRAWRKAMEDSHKSLGDINKELDARVVERTERLEKTNRMLGDEIEARESLQEQLLQSQKLEAIGQLASGVAHDFNNLLASIAGYADHLKKRYHEDEETRRSLDVILSSSAQGAELTKKLLEFARKGRYKQESIDVGQLIMQVDSLLASVLGDKIIFKKEFLCSGCGIKGDLSQLTQVLLNLGLNARDAMPDGGELIFKVEVLKVTADHHLSLNSGDYVCISVSDTGVGIEPGNLDKIFEPFFTTKKPGEGTGLGLSTVYGVMQSHGGAVEVISEKGAGACFKLYFPSVCCAQPSEPQEDDNIPLKPESLRGKFILVIDDRYEICQLCQDVLEAYGVNVIINNGADVIKILEQAKDIDLVLLDVVMPDLDGITVSDVLLNAYPDLSVVFMSGYSEGDQAAVLREKQPHRIGYIKKPFTEDDLIQEILSMFRQK